MSMSTLVEVKTIRIQPTSICANNMTIFRNELSHLKAVDMSEGIVTPDQLEDCSKAVRGTFGE